MNRAFLFMALVAAIMVASFHFANAESLEDKDRKWHICADVEGKAFMAQDPAKLDKILCKAIFDLEPGQECNEQAQVYAQLGFLQQALGSFLYNKVIVPKCGEHPEQH